MDIGAYAKINDLSTILDSTGINIPRLRGLRLMAMEERITEEEIKEMTASAEVDAESDFVYITRAEKTWLGLALLGQLILTVTLTAGERMTT